MQRITIGNYGKPRYERILEWLDCWNRVTQEPGELLFGRSLPNIIAAALHELDRRGTPKDIKRGVDSWMSELLDLIDAALAHADPTVALLTRDYPLQVAELRSLLAAGPVSPARLRPVLRTLESGPRPETVRFALQESLQAAPRSDDAMLYVTSTLLLRPFTTKHSESYLERIPTIALAHVALEQVIQPAIHALAEDPVVAAAARSAATGIANLQRVSAYLETMLPTDGLFGFSEELRWRQPLYGFLRRTSGTYAELIAVDVRAGRSALGDAVVKVLRDYAHLLLRYIIPRTAGAFFTWPIPEVQDAGEIIGARLASLTGLVNQRGAADYKQPLDRMCGDAVGDAVVETIAQALADSVLARDWSATNDAITDVILAAFSDQAATAARSVPASRIEELSLSPLAKRNVQDRLGAVLHPVAKAVLAELQQALPAAGANLPVETRHFWTTWLQMISPESSLQREIVHFCPWETMPEEAARRITERVLSECSPSMDEWLVISDLKGIEPQGQAWDVGAVTFYDPSFYDYGEGSFFGRDQAMRVGRATACTVIVADSAQMAARAARQRFEVALDMCSYAISHREEGYGIRAEFVAPEKLTNLSRQSWSGSWSDDLQERPRHIRRAAHDEIPALVEQYRPLLLLDSKNPAMLSPYDAQLLRALRAYRTGYWRPAPERYLRYWMGLEQMFARGEQTKILFERLPEIYITWRDIQGLSLSPVWRQAIFKEISAEYAEFQGDVPDDRPARTVLTVTEHRGWRTSTTRSYDAQAIFRRHTDQPPLVDPPAARIREFDTAVHAELHYRRARFRFLLHRLYDLRNLVVHEALPYRVDIEIYCDALEEIFEDILRKTVDILLDPTRSAQTFEELKVAVQAPWE
jgi:hypothetical protein